MDEASLLGMSIDADGTITDMHEDGLIADRNSEESQKSSKRARAGDSRLPIDGHNTHRDIASKSLKSKPQDNILLKAASSLPTS